MGVSDIGGRFTAEDLKRALLGRKGRVVHLTHNDLDAAGCDAIHRMVHGDLLTIWSSVGNFSFILSAISEVKGKGDLLSITDLGYQPGIERWLRKVREAGWKVEWRDHHRWETREGEIVRSHVALLAVDTSACACGIVARDLAGGDARAAEVARVVCDYDLWRNEDPRSTVLGRILSKPDFREYVRDRLAEGVFTDDTIRREYGRILEEMEEAIGKSIRHAKIFEGKYRVAFAPLYGYPSETASRMRETFHTGIEVIVSTGGRFSIRSVPPVSHLIARQFGGGGHPHASGGTFPFTFLDRVAFLLLKRSRHFQTLADAAASMGEAPPSP